MKPTIYRITHLWPNKGERGSTTAQIEEDRKVWTVIGVVPQSDLSRAIYAKGPKGLKIGDELTPAVVKPSSTVQIKPETDELNALPSRFVSLQDYEALEREGR